jgi:hypothetical protein
MVCPRRRREDEAEEMGDSSARRHLDGVEMSRHCTDWPRTLGQPSPILHGMAALPRRLTALVCGCARAGVESPRVTSPPPTECPLAPASTSCRGAVGFGGGARPSPWTPCPLPRRLTSAHPVLSAGPSSARIINQRVRVSGCWCWPAPRFILTALTTRSRNLWRGIWAPRTIRHGAQLSPQGLTTRICPTGHIGSHSGGQRETGI